MQVAIAKWLKEAHENVRKSLPKYQHDIVTSELCTNGDCVVDCRRLLTRAVLCPGDRMYAKTSRSMLDKIMSGSKEKISSAREKLLLSEIFVIPVSVYFGDRS